MKKPILIRNVWSENLTFELNLIKSSLQTHRFAAIDMEFPGNIFHAPALQKHHYNALPPDLNYSIMKTNVNLLKPIQFGLALSDPYGNLPDFGTDNTYLWEFNFRDFDPLHDPHNPDSVELLKRQGINFDENKELGIESNEFRRLISETGLIYLFPMLSWVTFQSSYDFGYMIKMLTQRQLPEDMGLVKVYFGMSVYDVKHMMKSCGGLYGGLEKVGKALGVDREVGMGHQAGSDSLLTLKTFLKLVDTYFNGRREEVIGLGGVIHGLGFIRHHRLASFSGMNVPRRLWIRPGFVKFSDCNNNVVVWQLRALY